jgi:hypothetical protein
MTLGWQEGDRIVERLNDAGDGMDDGELSRFLARLVLLLANELGDPEATLAAIDAARRAGNRPGD